MPCGCTSTKSRSRRSCRRDDLRRDRGLAARRAVRAPRVRLARRVRRLVSLSAAARARRHRGSTPTSCVCGRSIYAGREIFGWQDESTINNAVLGLPRDHRARALDGGLLRAAESLPAVRLVADAPAQAGAPAAAARGRAASQWGETGPAGLTAGGAASRLRGARAAVLAFLSDPLSELAHGLRRQPERAPATWSRAAMRLHLWNEMTRRAARLRPQRALPRRLAVRAAVRALRHQR